MTSGNSSTFNRYYYPLLEATKVLKAQGKSLSVYDLLHYGVQGVVRFFIHLPSGMRVRRIFGSLQYEHDQQANLLILSRIIGNTPRFAGLRYSPLEHVFSNEIKPHDTTVFDTNRPGSLSLGS